MVPAQTTTDDGRVRGLVAALLAHDAAAARRLVDDAADAGMEVPDLYTDLLQPAMYEIGHRWAVGTATVADEHFATTVAQSVLGALRERLRVPARHGRLAIVSCTPGELHALGAQVVADFLESDGWETLHLGASLPADELAGIVDAECPDLVALSTTTASGLPGVVEALAALRALPDPPYVVAGGQLWTDQVQADALAAGADRVLRDPRALLEHLHRWFPETEGRA
ncbi:B12-binding domain-containing protein [Conexibacter sp. SYSU D00693]|uniref:cobalamin B12-binding domain-containing protein n=1 Tax=Conexibacter sp. SYSU D00693 TaxID=2812560 RepID=UPI00196A50DE|nr:B12-binding domain-containing protein [Conexibacter sp. SYSU D00693]